jgi:acetoacetate decarboxylase
MKKLKVLTAVAATLFFSITAFADNSNKRLAPIEKQAIEFDLSGFGNYLNNGSAQTIEGVYTTEDRRYVIAVVKNQEKSHDYIGVVISADNQYWDKGEVKFNFVKQDDGSLKGFYYDQAGKAYPVTFDTNENGLQSDMMHKLSVAEVKMGNLAIMQPALMF